MSIRVSNFPDLGEARNHLPDELNERLFNHITEVSSLPAIVLEVIALAGRPDTDAEDLLEVVRRDPVLAMRLMRSVNSSYYAVENKVADLKQAIALVGFSEIRNLALTAYIAPLFEQTSGHGTYARRDLWNHMVASGEVARLVAITSGRVPHQEAYLAGLLHDIGFVLLDQYMHAPFCRVIDAVDEQTPVCRIELRILGFDHAALAQYVVRKWNLPEHQSVAIGYHHAAGQYNGPHRNMVNVVGLANYFCHLKGSTALGVRDIQRPPLQLFDELGLGPEEVRTIVAQLDQVLGDADSMATSQMR